MPRLLEATRNRKRQAFIDAGWHTIGAAGMTATTVDDVCAAAGSSKGAFYAHFGSKQELLLAMIRDDSARQEDALADIARGNRPPIRRLQRAIRWFLERAEESGYVRVHADIWSAALTDDTVRTELRTALEVRRRTLRGWVEEALARGDIRGVRANAVASVLIALTDGLLLDNALDPSAFVWRNVGAAVAQLLGEQ